MPIRYRIVVSKLPANRDGYIARVQTRDKVDMEQLAMDISRHGTTTSQLDIIKIFRYFGEELLERLLKGDIVNTYWGTFYLAVQGTFTGYEDHFNRNRHRLVIRFIPSRALYATLRRAQLQKVDSLTPVPCPVTYIDAATKQPNGPVTPGELGQLIGEDLRYDEDDPRQGIFFIAMDKTETRVCSAAINDPSMTIFLIPPLPAGQYRIAVRGAYGVEETIREGMLDHVLTVE